MQPLVIREVGGLKEFNGAKRFSRRRGGFHTWQMGAITNDSFMARHIISATNKKAWCSKVDHRLNAHGKKAWGMCTRTLVNCTTEKGRNTLYASVRLSARGDAIGIHLRTVSYTHLTLPTTPNV